MGEQQRSTTAGRRRLDRILAEGYLDRVEARSTEEVRAMRAECAEEEALLSYERRLLHGRLALLRFEIDRRSGSAEGSMVDNLAEILTEDRAPGRGGFPGADPDLEVFGEPKRRISKLVSDDTLANVQTLSDDEVRARLNELEEAERETSGVRARLLPIMDALNAEIGRRYASGEANPSDIL